MDKQFELVLAWDQKVRKATLGVVVVVVVVYVWNWIKS